MNRVEGGTAISSHAVASLLRRAWLLAATLAVIAGLLGMHVLTSGHSSHGPVTHSAPVTDSAPVTHGGSSPEAAAGHTAVVHPAGGGHALHAPAASATDMPGFASAACGGSCPGAQESGAPCVPSAPSGPGALSPPTASLAALQEPAAGGNARPAYGYLPPSPTPGDLSISRT